jgi:transposase
MAAAVALTGTWTLQIVRRCDRHRFVVLPKRWIVERTLAWISRNWRLAPAMSGTPAKQWPLCDLL